MFISKLKTIALETFESVNKLNPSFLHSLFNVKDTNYNLRGGIRLEQPKVNTEKCGIQTIRYQGARLWNLLPTDMKMSESIDDFKTHLAKWNGPKCTCGHCLPCRLPQF